MTTPVDPGPLGEIPFVEILPLVRGATWTWGWAATDGTTFDTGLGMFVIFTEPAGGAIVRCDAVMSDVYAAFRLEADDADTVPPGTLFTMYVSLPTTPNPTIIGWFQGKVDRHDS